MTAKEVASILRESHKCGVSELTFGDLCVRFHLPGSTRLVERQSTGQNSADPAEMGPAPNDVGDQPVEVPPDLQAAFDDQTLIEDPVAHETEVADRFLGNSAETDGRG